jgi:HK97 family phage portal protein
VKTLKIPFVSRFFERRSTDSSPSDSEKSWWQAFGVGGIRDKVTPATAMRSTAVLACVRILAEDIASLPLPVYRRGKDGGKSRADHAVADLLQRAPNPQMTAFTFKETMMAHILLWGNCYAEIETDSFGKIIALWPIPPYRVEHLETEKGDPVFRVTTKDGKMHPVPAYAMLHIPGLGFDGKKGTSVIQWARQAVELALATEEFGSNFYLNGMNVGAVVTHPSSLSDPAFDRLRKSLREQYEGLGKAHRMMLLEEGMTFAKNTIPPNDAQFLETRKFQTNEIARMFRVPPHKLADLERATFSNIEQQSIEYVTHSLRPWLVRLEQSINWKMFLGNEQKKFFAEFLIEGLLRGDSAARASFYKEMFMIGVYSQNDIRIKENENPIPGGDKYYVPLNMTEIGKTADPGLSGGGGDTNNEGDQGAEADPIAGEPAGSASG